MVVRGRVKNGVVVLDENVAVPEGQEVSVVVPDAPQTEGHSARDIPPVSVGAVLQPLTPDDDLLDEMLEGRRL